MTKVRMINNICYLHTDTDKCTAGGSPLKGSPSRGGRPPTKFRIIRNTGGEAPVKRLYPTGEGAGYG